MNKAVALGFRTRSETQKDPIAAIIGINMVAVYVESSSLRFVLWALSLWEKMT